MNQCPLVKYQTIMSYNKYAWDCWKLMDADDMILLYNISLLLLCSHLKVEGPVLSNGNW